MNEPDNAYTLQPIIDYIGRSQRYTDARALQQDALELALKAFGASPDATTLSLTGRETALHRIAVLRTLSLSTMPVGFLDGAWQSVTSRVVPCSGTSRTSYRFTANRQALEELFGVDLIYLNERRGSLVMVQYKMMDAVPLPHRQFVRPGSRAEKEWTVPINGHFLDQVDRMSLFDCDLDPDGPYRLNCGAFYFKLVERDAGTKTAEIILSLQHLRHPDPDCRLEC